MNKRIGFLFLVVLTILSCQKTQEEAEFKGVQTYDYFLGKNEPVTITCWHTYNSTQKTKFDSFVEKFNSTVGQKYGVFVKSISRTGDIVELAKFVNDAVDKKVGADEAPDIFLAYPDTAFQFNEKGLLVDFNDYLTEEEKSEFVQDFLYCSGFGVDDEIKLFPIAKATESFVLNKTAWQEFKLHNDVSIDDLNTWEGLVKVAEVYYKWTDSLTAEKNDGKAFFGFASVGNYALGGLHELGYDLFKVQDAKNHKFDLNKEAFRVCWDNYYIPFVKGFFNEDGRFRSDDLKQGNIISCITSSSSSVYLRNFVVDKDGNSKDIELQFLPLPHFKNAKINTAIQQGAGMVELKSSFKKELAVSLFLKWLTDVNQNIDFAFGAGYLPVKKDAIEKKQIKNFIAGSNEAFSAIVVNSTFEGIETIHNNKLFFQPGIKNSYKVRKLLTASLADKAHFDREKVKEFIRNGMSYDEAVSKFITDENFESAFNVLSEELKRLN